MWEEVLQKLRDSWKRYHIQISIAINIVVGILVLLRIGIDTNSVEFFHQYLLLLTLFAPLILLIICVLRREEVSVSVKENINGEQLYWWSMIDVSVGTSLLIYWLFTLFLWESISLWNILLIYISILVYIMFVFSIVLTVIRRFARFWTGILTGCVLHLALVVSTVMIENLTILGLKIFPQHMINNLFEILVSDYTIWEVITPVTVSVAVIWMLRTVGSDRHSN